MMIYNEEVANLWLQNPDSTLTIYARVAWHQVVCQIAVKF